MVDPDADNTNTSSKTGSAIAQQSIPVSCQKHSADATRSVGTAPQIAWSSDSCLALLLGKSSSAVAKRNTRCDHRLVLLGLRNDTDCIVGRCQLLRSKAFPCIAHLHLIRGRDEHTDILQLSSGVCYSAPSAGRCRSSKETNRSSKAKIMLPLVRRGDTSADS